MLAEKVRAWSVGASVAARPTPELAVLALLLEIARADHEFDPAERQLVKEAAASVLGLTEDEAQALLAVAEQRVEDSFSLDEFTSVLNDTLTLADKRRCLLALWRVALADGRLDRFEEYALRKLGDLLHLSHADFIQAKLAAGGR
jgi:uncharacterized tellurite resistance protein B-like protein